MIGIYRITNKITGRTYIGQSSSIGRRFKAHKKAAEDPKCCHHDNELYDDMRKYGKENFEFVPLETFSLDVAEEKWIQKYLHDGIELYNKELTPTHHTSQQRFSDEQINRIIELLKSGKMSNIKIAKIMNCSSSTVDNINNGKSYKIDGVAYPISPNNSRPGPKKGEQNHQAKFSDEEVMTIRREYVRHTAKELYKKYGKNVAYDSFEEIVEGRSYSNLPVYKKYKKQWYLHQKLYRLEP